MSDKGKTVRVSLRADFFEVLTVHKFDAAAHPVEYGMESLIFKRQLTEAFQKAIELTRKITSRTQALNILGLCSPHKRRHWTYETEDADDNDDADRKDSLIRFEEELASLSYLIPERFPIPVQDLVGPVLSFPFRIALRFLSPVLLPRKPRRTCSWLRF